MAQIICFANSFKHEGRCIAGIDLTSKEWVRPIGDGTEGAIGSERLINSAEPELLDILEIPLGSDADDFGCQPENKVLQNGQWHKIGKITKEEALKYTEVTNRLLHNFEKSVPASEFNSNIRRADWKSLQLIRAQKAFFNENPWGKTECSFQYSGHFYSLKAPCPEADNHINSRIDCILTISMGGPYRRDKSGPLRCWKMIAGVIQL